MPVFGLVAGKPHIQYIGDLQLTGVLAFIAVVGHEQGHRAMYLAGIQTGPFAHLGPNGELPTDNDADGVVDWWEDSHHLDSANPDTTQGANLIAPGDGGKQDREVLANIFALGNVVKFLNAWKQDWAKQSIQFGQRPLLFPLAFQPANTTGVTGNPTSEIPANALTSLMQLGP